MQYYNVKNSKFKTDCYSILLSTLHLGARDAIKLNRFGRNRAQESLKIFFKKMHFRG